MTTEITIANSVNTRAEIITRAVSTFGTLTPMDIEPEAPKGTTVTSITQSVHAMVHKSIEVLLAKQKLSKLRKDDCRPCKIIAKQEGNIQVKLGYGKRNAPFADFLPVKHFQSVGEAVEYLKKLDELLTKGFFEADINSLLERYRITGEIGRAARAEKLRQKKMQTVVKDAVETFGPNVYPISKK
jgi:hypothetical protein